MKNIISQDEKLPGLSSGNGGTDATRPRQAPAEATRAGSSDRPDTAAPWPLDRPPRPQPRTPSVQSSRPPLSGPGFHDSGPSGAPPASGRSPEPAQAAHPTFRLLQRVHVGVQLRSPALPRPHRSSATPSRPAAPTPTSNNSPAPLLLAPPLS